MAYKSVTVRIVPTPRQAELIDHCLLKVSKLLEISKREFQLMIWHQARQNEDLREEHTRLLDLLSQRFASTVMGNVLYPLDKRNYSFVKKEGWYKIEVRFRPKTRVTIPIARPERKYYADILDGTAHPAFIYKYGADYFLSVSIPFERRYEEDRLVVYIGIDLNQRKHAASLYNPMTQEYEQNFFFDLKPVDEKVKKIQREITAIQMGKRMGELSKEDEGRIDRLYGRGRKVIDKGHGDFISKLMGIADEYWGNGCNVVFVLEDLEGITKRVGKGYPSFNRWLHSQWCYRRFGILLETHGYPVEQVNPRGTSTTCHRCGAKLEIYGRHKRLVRCNICGLSDFSRELNAARELAPAVGEKHFAFLRFIKDARKLRKACHKDNKWGGTNGIRVNEKWQTLIPEEGPGGWTVPGAAWGNPAASAQGRTLVHALTVRGPGSAVARGVGEAGEPHFKRRADGR